MRPVAKEAVVPSFVVATLLTCSGACALIFQVVWIRELRLIFGATTSASAAVLAIFMGGLGLGNFLLGRRIDRNPAPLRVYGKLEAGIAFSAAISPLLVELSRAIYLGLGGQATLGFPTATGLRLLFSALILGVPTILMGGTLPAAAKAVSSTKDPYRRGVALVYGMNTLGAVLGAGIANFYLLEAWGGRWTLWSACGLNAGLACIALLLSARYSRTPVDEHAQEASSNDDAPAETKTSSQFLTVCLTSGFVGFVFFLMELVWYRMLGPLLGGTTYTFGLILCLALLGIGIGGAAYSLLARWIRPTHRLLALTCALEAFLIALPFFYGDRVALWVLEQQRQGIDSFGEQVWNWFQIGGFVILPPAIISGFQFPVLIAVAGTGRENVGRQVGLTFAANTLGAICGSLAGGFLLLPLLSAPGLWIVCIWILIGLTCLLALAGRREEGVWLSPAVVTSLLAGCAILFIGPTAVWRHSGIGAGRAELIGTGQNAEQRFINEKRRQTLWEGEGLESSVAVTATDSLAFLVNGKSDGNAYGDAGTQIGLGLIGPLLHPDPQRGLVIGLGTGESAGWLADCRNMESVDVIELEPIIMFMAELCTPMNRDVLNNPKVHIEFNDAREFLLTTPNEYDLIVSEPSNPYRAGIANLYTQEFYEAAAARLSSDGLFLQWLQGYEVDPRTVKSVLTTLRSVFPATQIWRTKSRDLVLVCGRSKDSLSFQRDELVARLQDSTLSEGLQKAWRVTDLEGVLAHYVGGDEAIDTFLDGSDQLLNTDDRNLLEYAFALTVGKSTRFSIHELQQLADRSDNPFPISIDDEQKEAIARRRLAMLLHLGGEIPANEAPQSVDPDRVAAYRAYLDEKYEEAAKHFGQSEPDLSCPIDTLVFAHTMAETGRPIDEEILATVRAQNETEAAAIEAISAWHRGEQDASIKHMVTAFEKLRQNPWGSWYLFDSLIRLSGRAGQVSPTAAEAIFDELEDPFSMFRLEDKRLLLRYLASESLSPDKTVIALEALEPNVPWIGWLLENRARVYESVDHPLSRTAASDLQLFQYSEPPK
ncbi:fused MFS/spermidine synthase [Thalassoglobus neptunius]|uniref:fused MFS/spermidine synthase n=1 Tax=Thalassoglobus neptunius TaxID=1938619 RepID=UPI0018D25E04|nr:fused MFS/spermidine synthase [Thalassoglobus neptunius]